MYRRLGLLAAIALPLALSAQETPAPVEGGPEGPVLSSFAAMRVAVMPVQLVRSDSVGWSKGVSWAEIRAEFDTAVGETLRDRGLGSRWLYAADVVRTARRNPIYTSDPYALGVGRWRSMPPKIGEDLSHLVADNLRPFTALGDTRYALVPVELRVEADAVIVRLVLVDTRIRTVVWVGDLGVTAGRDFVPKLAARVADLVVEP